MAFSNIGPRVELEPGQSVTWEYAWEHGQDMGLQLAGPDHFPPSPGTLARLAASNQAIAVNGFGQSGGLNVSYFVTITNLSSDALGVHNLQGGGVA